MNMVRKDTMSKEKFRLDNKLGTSGAITTVVLVITTIITGLLLIVSGFIRFVLNDSERIQRFLETFGISVNKTREVFDIDSSVSWIGSLPATLVLAAVILFLLVLWVSLYKVNSVYIYRAFRGYGVSLICISCLLIVFGMIIGPVIYRFAGNYYFGYEDAFKMGKWLLLFSSLPVFLLGLFMLFISLFAAFPAKTDMKRPRKNGEKDVSFIMDDEDENQIFEDSEFSEAPNNLYDKVDASAEEVQTSEVEIVGDTCPNCGAVTYDGDVFCTACGTKL